MIAQDFARVRVLGSGSIAMPYGVATACAHAGIKCPTGGAFGPARGPTPPCEGAASAVCIRQNIEKKYIPD